MKCLHLTLVCYFLGCASMSVFLESLPGFQLCTNRSLMRSLLLMGLLSAHGDTWAATWNITFTPQQTTDTPPQPMYNWTPPDAATMFGAIIRCTDGFILSMPRPTNVVFPTGGGMGEAYVQFTNIYAAPSIAAVNIMPSSPGGTATCSLNPVPKSYKPG